MDNNNLMAQFMDQIDEAMRVPRRGHVIKGKIVQVTDNSLIVNIGYKSDGIVPLDEIQAVHLLKFLKATKTIKSLMFMSSRQTTAKAMCFFHSSVFLWMLTGQNSTLSTLTKLSLK